MALEAKAWSTGDRIDYTPSGADVVAGEVVVIGSEFCGVATEGIADGKLGSIAVRGVFKCAKTSPLVISAGDAVFWSDSTNKVTKTSSDVYLGAAIEAAASDATEVTVLLGSARQPETLGVTDLPTVASGDEAIPVLIHAVCVAAGAEDEVVIAETSRKLKVVDAWLVSRDTNAANVKLHSGTAGADDITDAVAKGATDDAIVRFGKIIAEKDEVASGGTIIANFSAAGAVDVFVLAVPVE